jgi:hypothetical protein
MLLDEENLVINATEEQLFVGCFQRGGNTLHNWGRIINLVALDRRDGLFVMAAWSPKYLPSEKGL